MATTVTPAALANAAQKFRKELIVAAAYGAPELYQWFTKRTMVQTSETVGQLNYNGEPRPYQTTTKNASTISVEGRTLETHVAQIWDDFNPMELIKTLYVGPGTNGQALKDSDISKAILTAMANNTCNALVRNLWTAKYNGSGTGTKDVFDGLDTITTADIAAGKVADGKKNLGTVDAVNEQNIIDVLNDNFASMDPILKAKNTIMSVDPALFYMYLRAMKLEGSGVQWQKEYNFPLLENSFGKCRIVPMIGKAGSKLIHVTPKQNMLIGVNDEDPLNAKVEVLGGSGAQHPDVLTYFMKFFFGTQFESVRAEDFYVIKIGA